MYYGLNCKPKPQKTSLLTKKVFTKKIGWLYQVLFAMISALYNILCFKNVVLSIFSFIIAIYTKSYIKPQHLKNFGCIYRSPTEKTELA